LQKEVWDTLKDVYKPEGFTTNYLFFKQFLCLQLADFDDMESFVTKAKELVAELGLKGWNFNKECIFN